MLPVTPPPRGGGVHGLAARGEQLHQVPVGGIRLGQERGRPEVKQISWPILERKLFRIREVKEDYAKKMGKVVALDYGQLGAGRGTW